MKKELVVLIKTADDLEIKMMGFMYAHNALLKHWWEKVTIIIWGPSGKTIIGSQELSLKLMEMKKDGVAFKACQACAEMLGISQELKDLGINVYYIGEDFTDYLKREDCKILSI